MQLQIPQIVTKLEALKINLSNRLQIADVYVYKNASEKDENCETQELQAAISSPRFIDTKLSVVRLLRVTLPRKE